MKNLSVFLGVGLDHLAIGGDSFDARIIDALVAPALGRDTSYRDAFGAVTVVMASAKAFVALRVAESVTFAVKLKVPA